MKFNKIVFLLFSFLFALSLSAQERIKSGTAVSDTAVKSKKRTYVHLLHADIMKFDKQHHPDAQILVGDVQLRRDSMYMFCDSAYLYGTKNAVKAFGNVRMEQGDTLFLYGDYVDYSGDENMARVRGNVRLIDRNTVLETDSLNYDRNANMGYYFNGGVLYDEESTLESLWGQYEVNTKDARFDNEVLLQNPQFILSSDTLCYNTATKIAKIVGPTEIDSDTTRIVSELGYYNTATRRATLLNRSVVYNGDKSITADSLLNDEITGVSEAFGNIFYSDTINRNLMTGNYGYFNQMIDSAYTTGKAVVVDYSQGDSLFVHADTIRMVSYNLKSDSVYRHIRAFNKVRAYRSDMQAVCDSLQFDSRDSCMTMYHDPIVWHGKQQLLGEEIKAYMDTASIKWVHVVNQALYVESVDTNCYNQIRGTEMKFYFKDKVIDNMHVIGNVEVVYFPLDSDSTLMGMNTTIAAKLSAYMEDGELSQIVIPVKSNGVFYPMSQIPPSVRYLDTFSWFDYVRPLNKEDIMIWRGKRRDQQLKKIKRAEIPLPKLENHQ